MRLSLPLLCLAAIACACTLATGSAQPLPLPALSYEYGALEPVLSEAAMRVHHLGHHQTYTDNLNAALRELRERSDDGKALAKLGVDSVLAKLDHVPEDLRQRIRKNGGGYVNHDLYWKTLSAPTPAAADGSVPPRVPSAESALLKALLRDFGSFDTFKSKFDELALGVFGSGWVFLYVDGSSKQLKLLATANQDNPAILDQNAHHVHLMCLDVWEHAYYVDYKNKRADFLRAWWNIVNWPGIESKYASFLTYDAVMQEIRAGRRAKDTAVNDKDL